MEHLAPHPNPDLFDTDPWLVLEKTIEILNVLPSRSVVLKLLFYLEGRGQLQYYVNIAKNVDGYGYIIKYHHTDETVIQKTSKGLIDYLFRNINGALIMINVISEINHRQNDVCIFSCNSGLCKSYGKLKERKQKEVVNKLEKNYKTRKDNNNRNAVASYLDMTNRGLPGDVARRIIGEASIMPDRISRTSTRKNRRTVGI